MAIRARKKREENIEAEVNKRLNARLNQQKLEQPKQEVKVVEIACNE